jgi:gliding motility-associated-like protein
MTNKIKGSGRILFCALIRPAALTAILTAFVLLFGPLAARAQNCYVINSVPSTPPTSGQLDTMVSATSQYYCTQQPRIYDSFTVDGYGSYATVPLSNGLFTGGGGLNHCGLWGKLNPLTLGFSVCIDVPADKSYYIGYAADNAGTMTIDGTTVLKNVGYEYWALYKITLTKGIHFLGFSTTNWDITTPASVGFEIYDNTEQQLMNATRTDQLNVLFSSSTEINHPAQTGDPATTYGCPVNYIVDYCSTTSNTPVCSQFVPINVTITNPPPACQSDGANITLPQVTAGNPTGLVYSYWLDSLATQALPDPTRIPKGGTYYIMANGNNCSVVKPVTVVVNSGSTTIAKTICRGDSYEGHYKTGTYLDTLKSVNGCDSVVTLNLTVNAGVSLGPDRTICAGDSVLLQPGGYASYLWQDNSTRPTYLVTVPGTYWVTATDQNGCTTSDTVVVKFGACFTAKIPNTFTPNGDGINDTWNISALQYFPQCSVLIYNRWGLQVYQSTGYAKPWEGKQSGKNLPIGVYYYVIDLKNNTKPMTGFVTIIR